LLTNIVTNQPKNYFEWSKRRGHN